mmetsp:Transcript_5119/g.16910  ORF Transcript_5119/g.16910 Transcript_5119/m.16910 type:complete len:505 (+) Transcript_5119:380-1894(+)
MRHVRPADGRGHHNRPAAASGDAALLCWCLGRLPGVKVGLQGDHRVGRCVGRPLHQPLAAPGLPPPRLHRRDARAHRHRVCSSHDHHDGVCLFACRPLPGGRSGAVPAVPDHRRFPRHGRRLHRPGRLGRGAWPEPRLHRRSRQRGYFRPVRVWGCARAGLRSAGAAAGAGADQRAVHVDDGCRTPPLLRAHHLPPHRSVGAPGARLPVSHFGAGRAAGHLVETRHVAGDLERLGAGVGGGVWHADHPHHLARPPRLGYRLGRAGQSGSGPGDPADRAGQPGHRRHRRRDRLPLARTGGAQPRDRVRQPRHRCDAGWSVGSALGVGLPAHQRAAPLPAWRCAYVHRRGDAHRVDLGSAAGAHDHPVAHAGGGHDHLLLCLRNGPYYFRRHPGGCAPFGRPLLAPVGTQVPRVHELPFVHPAPVGARGCLSPAAGGAGAHPWAGGLPVRGHHGQTCQVPAAGRGGAGTPRAADARQRRPGQAETAGPGGARAGPRRNRAGRCRRQ